MAEVEILVLLESVVGTPFFQYLAIVCPLAAVSSPATYTSFPETKIDQATARCVPSVKAVEMLFFQYLATLLVPIASHPAA